MSSGWLPEWLPRSAVNIRERHNIDTNLGAFSFVAVEGWTAPIHCVPAINPPSPVVTPSNYPTSAETKPGVLKCDDLYVLMEDNVVYGLAQVTRRARLPPVFGRADGWGGTSFCAPCRWGQGSWGAVPAY